MIKNILSRFKADIKEHPKLDLAVLLIGLAFFITITFVNITNASIWFDEAFSAYIARFNFWEIAVFTANDVHPPFYYWMLKIWTIFFGSGDVALRSLSILFGVATISVAFFLARKLFGRAVAWTSLLFLVLSPMLIRYSDEARMYTLATLIVIAATYVLVKATEQKSRKLWVWYGVLVALGMWTHYFTAFMWLAHWVWRAIQTWRKGSTFKQWWKRFFAKDWVIAYSVALGVFLPWLVVMGYQLGVVQASGFWIGPVSIDTPANYLGNYFYYLEHYEVQSWLAFGLIAISILLIALAPRVYKTLSKPEKSAYLLVTTLAWVPPVLLFLASLPPLRPSFVERYLLPAIVALSVFIAVTLIVGMRRWKPVYKFIPIILIVAMMTFGISKVFYYSNFNKNTMYHVVVKQVVSEIHQRATPGQPIVASTPWVFYEAVQYATPEHPVYFIGATAQDDIGSLVMLQQRDQFKITDFDAFAKQYPVIWYIGQNSKGDLEPYKPDWTKLQTVQVKDEITGNTIYRAAEFRVSN